MSRSHIIEIIALFRLRRWERLDRLLAQCRAREIAEALMRLSDGEQMELLQRLEPLQRSAAIMALDYPAWIRLVESAGPMATAWTCPTARCESLNTAHAQH